MRQYDNRTIDELGRLVLNRELRTKLALEAGSRLQVTCVDTIAILQPTETLTTTGDTVCKVDELGRILMPKKIRQALGWNTLDEVSAFQTGNLIILKSA